MAGHTHTHYVINCDSCGSEFMPGVILPTAIEARARAYADGWRFPPRIKRNGEPAGNQVTDICGNCEPVDLPASDTWKNRR